MTVARLNVADWAQVYTAMQLRVLAVQPAVVGDVGSGKRPLDELTHGKDQATLDPNVIASWFANGHSNRNIGIACGPSQLVVLDADLPKEKNGFTDGVARLAELESEIGELPPSPIADTGSGALHRVYRAPAGVEFVGKVGRAIDVIRNGYIVAPPSKHFSGGAYSWRDGYAIGEIEIAELPREWVEFLRRPEPVARPATVGTTTAEDFYDALASLDQRAVLSHLSGSSIVNGEQFAFKSVGRGKYNIFVDRGDGFEGTSNFIDANGKIAARSTGKADGGPLASQWLRWYRADDKAIRRALIENVPELGRFERTTSTRSVPDDCGATSEPQSDVPPPTDDDAPNAGPQGSSKPSTATLLVRYAQAESEIWRSTEGDVYATVQVGEHREHIKIDSKNFRRWLARLAWDRLGRSVGDGPIKAAAATLGGIAAHGDAVYETPLRIAEHEGHIWIDLGDPEWRAIQVTESGWRIVADPPVRFVRRSSMSSLPDPVFGGDIADLRDHVHINDESWPLVVGWLVGALSPWGPYPVLTFRGQHGAGKSMAARRLRSLVDPSIAPIRAEPREPRDLVIGALSSHVIALDNISALPGWLSDGLCRLSTGGGYAARALFTDGDEFVIDVKRPAILTGITDVISAPDLLDRALLVELDAIAPEDREQERVLDEKWEAAAPKLFGSLCTALCTGLRRRPDIKLARLPRLADWAHWVASAAPSLGLEDDDVITALEEQNDEKTEIALESTPIAKPLIALVASRVDRAWTGTASELLAELTNRVDIGTTREKTWPRTPKAMSNAVMRIARPLRDRGVVAERLKPGAGGRRGVRAWSITSITMPETPEVKW